MPVESLVCVRTVISRGGGFFLHKCLVNCFIYVFLHKKTHNTHTMKHNCPEVSITYSHKVPVNERIKIATSSDAAKLARSFYREGSIEHIESTYVISLNKANRVNGFSMIGSGGTAQCVIDLKVVMQMLIKTNASSFILVHNHPSGALKASDADIKITRRAREIGELLDISLLDHIIVVPEGGYFSFTDDGIL